jgi:hypothetical protein
LVAVDAAIIALVVLSGIAFDVMSAEKSGIPSGKNRAAK